MAAPGGNRAGSPRLTGVSHGCSSGTKWEPPGRRAGDWRAPCRSREGAVRAPIRFLLVNDIQNRTETVRLSAGPPAMQIRAPSGLLRVVYGLSAVLRAHENAGKIGSSLLSTMAPVRLVKNSPGPFRIVGHPTGTTRKWPKSLFLLAVRGPDWICDSSISHITTGPRAIVPVRRVDFRYRTVTL